MKELKQIAISKDSCDLKFLDIQSSRTLEYIIEDLFEKDEYGFDSLSFLPGDVVVDIGANVGVVSVYLAKKYPDIQVYSFEAHPVNYENLLKNINLNNVSNVKPFNLAVSSSDDKDVSITLAQGNSGSSSLFIVDPKDPLTATVKTISLDSIIRNNSIAKINFLKLDCEGSEFDILENSKLIHEISIENISAEIHTYMKSKNKNVDNLIELINSISKNKPNCKLYTLGYI
jgi:FkbM family methyltransferase